MEIDEYGDLKHLASQEHDAAVENERQKIVNETAAGMSPDEAAAYKAQYGNDSAEPKVAGAIKYWDESEELPKDQPPQPKPSDAMAQKWQQNTMPNGDWANANGGRELSGANSGRRVLYFGNASGLGQAQANIAAQKEYEQKQEQIQKNPEEQSASARYAELQREYDRTRKQNAAANDLSVVNVAAGLYKSGFDEGADRKAAAPEMLNGVNEALKDANANYRVTGMLMKRNGDGSTRFVISTVDRHGNRHTFNRSANEMYDTHLNALGGDNRTRDEAASAKAGKDVYVDEISTNQRQAIDAWNDVRGVEKAWSARNADAIQKRQLLADQMALEKKNADRNFQVKLLQVGAQMGLKGDQPMTRAQFREAVTKDKGLHDQLMRGKPIYKTKDGKPVIENGKYVQETRFNTETGKDEPAYEEAAPQEFQQRVDELYKQHVEQVGNNSRANNLNAFWNKWANEAGGNNAETPSPATAPTETPVPTAGGTDVAKDANGGAIVGKDGKPVTNQDVADAAAELARRRGLTAKPDGDEGYPDLPNGLMYRGLTSASDGTVSSSVVDENGTPVGFVKINPNGSVEKWHYGSDNHGGFFDKSVNERNFAEADAAAELERRKAADQNDTGAVVDGNLSHEGRKWKLYRDSNGKIKGYGTTRSIVTKTEDGKYAVIPTIVNGEELSDSDADAQFRKSGQHWGIYDSPEAARARAEEVHQKEQEVNRAEWNNRIHENWDEISDEIKDDELRKEHDRRMASPAPAKPAADVIRPASVGSGTQTQNPSANARRPSPSVQNPPTELDSAKNEERDLIATEQKAVNDFVKAGGVHQMSDDMSEDEYRITNWDYLPEEDKAKWPERSDEFREWHKFAQAKANKAKADFDKRRNAERAKVMADEQKKHPNSRKIREKNVKSRMDRWESNNNPEIMRKTRKDEGIYKSFISSFD